MRFYLIDDDPVGLAATTKILKKAGHEVRQSTDSEAALADIASAPPDCVITDLMMPGPDGFEICRRLRDRFGPGGLKIVVASAKGYDFDQRRAREMGADGYFVKPLVAKSFLARLEDILSSTLTLDFWGVRGTLPVCGRNRLKYGGSTSCVSLTFSDGSLFIFDAGSGIVNLGNSMMASGERQRAKIFISHPHWDHINAFPFFKPLFVRGNEFEVLGPAHTDRTMRDLIGAQMDGVYFPITMTEFGASVTFRDLREESLAIDATEVRTLLLSHPGNCLGYRVTHDGRSLCYVTDNELFLPSHPEYNPAYLDRLTEFVGDADLLITDTTYTDEAYAPKVGWGHSCIGQVAGLAHAAGVKELALFHHDPDDTDDDIDAKLEAAAAALKGLSSSVEVTAPVEGERRSL